MGPLLENVLFPPKADIRAKLERSQLAIALGFCSGAPRELPAVSHPPTREQCYDLEHRSGAAVPGSRANNVPPTPVTFAFAS
jgi:hypothetical protein